MINIDLHIFFESFPEQTQNLGQIIRVNQKFYETDIKRFGVND